MHIALIEPEIPGNTGSIGRVCVGTDTPLHLVGKLGFAIDEAAVRRAGLDYWPKVRLRQHRDLAALQAALPGQRLWFFSAHGAARYDQVTYRPDDVLMSFLPLAHTYERQCGHGTAMHAAVTIAYSSPQTLLQDLQVFRPTVFMSVPRIYERIYMAMREMASQSPVKKAVFEFAMRTGLQLTEARADKDGFIDMSEGIDFTRGVGPGLVLKYKLVDHLVFRKVRSLLGGRFRFAFSAAGCSFFFGKSSSTRT